MPLAYYSVAAEQEFWTEHWGLHSAAELLEVARRSPLTRLLTDALPPQGRILEAGCGLGQYVVLLRERGWRAVGVDWSVDTLAAARRSMAVPLAAMELRTLAIRTAALAAYVSLGVVEHDPDGPDAILAEGARALAPGGVLLVSVPYVNGMRRLGRRWLERRERGIARRGGAFYQYAFTRREVCAILARHGFAVVTLHPYDPARILRGALRRFSCPRPAATADVGTPRARRQGEARGRLPGIARRLLYAPPMLRLFGHMLLAVAVKHS